MISFAQSLSKYLVDSFKKYFPVTFMFDNRRKNRIQLFFQTKVRLFFSKIWFFINLLGFEKLILLLPQYLSKHLLDPYSSSREVCHTRFYAKKRHQIISFTGKIAFFLKKKCDFNNLLGLKKRLWQARQYW